MRKITLLASTILCFAALSAAQVPTSGNVFFGYSYYNTDEFYVHGFTSGNRTSTNGWEASLEGHVFPFVGIVADFSSHYGSTTFGGLHTNYLVSANITQHNYLFGPRVGVSVGKFRPFAEAMFGAAHVNANSVGSDTSFATALGGGLDYRLIRLLAWRFQGDYVQTRFFGTTQNNVRLSTGIVVRF